MPFRIIRNDITKVKADAIVNTANPEPRFAGGTDFAIYKAAGEKSLLEKRREIGRIAPGEAAVTPAFALNARFIIHTVGPQWIDGEHGEFEILRSCYKKSLVLADSLGCESIAFPLIATGVYGFPKDIALRTALDVIREHLENSELDVTLVVFERDSYRLASSLTERIEEYIDENYVGEKTKVEYRERFERFGGPMFAGNIAFRSNTAADLFCNRASLEETDAAEAPKSAPAAAQGRRSLDDIVNNLGESFRQRLFRMIDERGMTDAQVYKRANIDRKLFSKIRCSEDYIPKKKTIVSLAIALRLDLDDTRDLLAAAGLLLTNNSKSDVIVSFCIENGIYDIYEVNALLFKFDEPILG